MSDKVAGTVPVPSAVAKRAASPEIQSDRRNSVGYLARAQSAARAKRRHAVFDPEAQTRRERACYYAAIALLTLVSPCRADDATPPTIAALSPFGIGSCYINNRSVDDNQRWLPQIAAIGVHVHRTPETTWHALEPVEGQWHFDALDRQMQYLTDHKFRFGALALGNPSWNKADAPGSLPVHNLKAWSKYVTKLCEHVKGKIAYLEVWNEPPNFTGKDQTPADYAKIVVAAYDAAKAVDPNLPVAIAAKSADVCYLERAIKAGAKDHFDMITLHPYEVLDGVADNRGTEPVFIHIAPTVRKMLAAQNPAKANVPIIFTELGADGGKNANRQAEALAKAYTLAIAQGISCVEWFEGRDGDSGPMGLLDGQGTPRPAYTALAQLVEHLGQKPRYLGWLLVADKHYGFAFEGSQGPVIITWASRRKPDGVALGQQCGIVDPLTGHITEAQQCELKSTPVLLLNPPQKWLAEAKTNRDKPLRWDGDYSSADAVSISVGDATVEMGLHTLSGAEVAAAVEAYGGSARRGDIPGGNMFVVDPSFLSYDHTPLEISIEIRRNAANDNAGFNLIYESTSGLKSVGSWYTVPENPAPDNKQWHTKTWRIDDTEFVSMWGYNFTFNSDGNQYNRYLLRSVTVRKVKPTSGER